VTKPAKAKAPAKEKAPPPPRGRRIQKHQGRPSKLTPELTKAIAAEVEAGNYLETAAALHGINRETLHAWLKRGARAEQAGTTMLPGDGVFAEFSSAVKRAWASAESVSLRAIRGSEDFRAHTWYLERTRRDRYSPKMTVETAEAAAPTTVDLSRLTTEELEQWEALAAKAAVSAPEKNAPALIAGEEP